MDYEQVFIILRKQVQSNCTGCIL